MLSDTEVGENREREVARSRHVLREKKYWSVIKEKKERQKSPKKIK